MPAFYEGSDKWAMHDDDDGDEDFSNVAVIMPNHNVIGLTKTSDLEGNLDDVCTLESVTQAENMNQEYQNSSTSSGSRRWYHNEHARNGLIKGASAFYCFCLMQIALVFELSYALSQRPKTRDRPVRDQLLGIYMYLGAIAFFIYCYAVILVDPHWIREILQMRKKFTIKISKTATDDSVISFEDHASTTAATIRRHISHQNTAASSLYLRLGCITFGLIGVVFFAFAAYLCVEDQRCKDVTVTLYIFGVVFIFIQMHFIFANSKMSIHGSYTIARFGLMHLVAANLWTWLRHSFMEEIEIGREMRHLLGETNTTIEPSPRYNLSEERDVDSSGSKKRECYTVQCQLGEIGDVMLTSIIEYSLIGATVMFIIWHNIGRHTASNKTNAKPKHEIRLDCSRTTTGLFLGFAYLAGSFTIMAIYYVFSTKDDAIIFYAVTELTQYLIAGGACVFALWRMRLLYYHHHLPNRNTKSQELLDMIFLSIGFGGELVHSLSGIVQLMGLFWTDLTTCILFLGHIVRLFQVITQSCLIFIANNLRTLGDPTLRQLQPGKHTITFLIMANITMFLMNLFVANKANSRIAVQTFYDQAGWVFLICSLAPLMVFYRFHSSVCFAEILKNTYAWKNE